MKPSALTSLVFAAMLVMAGAASASSTDLRVPYGGSYAIKLTSLKEARFKTTVRQEHDYSCGSAATATLLTYQYGHRVTEADVFKNMYASGDKARIRTEGFSLLDMRRYLLSQGFEADGFNLPLDKLIAEELPAIVLLNDRGYKHFVVIKGMKAGRVLIGDPARGTRSMPRPQFERLWENRVLFVVHNRRDIAQFNQPRDWRTAPPAPMETGIQRDGLRNVVMPRRGPGEI